MHPTCDGTDCKHLRQILNDILNRLDQLSAVTPPQPPSKEFLTTEEFAARVRLKSGRTVRDYLNAGRLNGVKQKSGRGRSLRWALHAEEVSRYEREGLLPSHGLVAA